MNSLQGFEMQAASDIPLGLRLRRAREDTGLSIAAVADALRLPVVIVEAMEREDVSRLGAPIYLRGNYLSYARHVGVPPALVEAFCSRYQAEPEALAPSTHVPRSRVLFDRYVKRSVYVILTASIVPSVIWLASLDRQAAPVLTLMESPSMAQTELSSLPAPDLPSSPDRPVSEQAPALQPVKASLAPAYLPAAREAEIRDRVALAPSQPGEEAESSIEFRFVEDSWIEVVSRDGRKLDSGIVRAGESRSFPRASVAKVSLGNAGGVEVGLGGETVDLGPFRRANVARFALSSAGSVIPAEG